MTDTETTPKTKFKFSELSKEAQQAAIETYREEYRETRSEDAGDNLKEVYAELLDDVGLEDCKTWWNLNSCQGDGVAFEGAVDMHAFVHKQHDLRWRINMRRDREIDTFAPQHVARGVRVGVKAHATWSLGPQPENLSHKRPSYGFCRCNKRLGLRVARITRTGDGLIRIERHHERFHEERRKYLLELAMPPKGLKALQRLINRNVSMTIKIKHSGNYTHANSMDFEIDVDDYGNADMYDKSMERKRDQVNDLEAEFHNEFKEYIQHLSKVFEHKGYEHFSYYDEDDTVAEDIINDVMQPHFTADGDLWDEDAEE